MTEDLKPAADLAEEHGATEEDPGTRMAQDTLRQSDELIAKTPEDVQAEHEAASGTYTVVDQTGQTHEIIRKEARGEDIVLVSTEGIELAPSTAANIGDLMGVTPYGMGTEGGTVHDDDTDYSDTKSAEQAAEEGDVARGIDRTGDNVLIDPAGEAPATEEELEAEETDATDAAKELADEKGVDLGEVVGTGAEGRVTKADVEAALEDDEVEG